MPGGSSNPHKARTKMNEYVRPTAEKIARGSFSTSEESPHRRAGVLKSQGFQKIALEEQEKFLLTFVFIDVFVVNIFFFLIQPPSRQDTKKKLKRMDTDSH
jgi:hypothetical protein